MGPAPGTDSPAGRRPWDARLPAAIIPLFALALYLPCLGYGFTGWDDTRYITENPLILEPGGLARIWFSGEPDQYYPLTFTIFWIEHHLWGDSALGYHATNAILHALNTLLLLLVLRRLDLSRWTSCAASLLFAAHPVHVMSVAWVAERKNLVSTLFCLLAYYTWIRFRREGGEGWYVGALAAFILALLAKTAVLPLPIALVALDRCVLGVSWRRALGRAAPLFVPVAVFALLTIRFEQPFIEGMPARGVRPLIAGEALFFYARQLLAPIRLLPFYPKWSVSPASIVSWLPLAVVLATALALWLLRRRLDGILAFGLVHFIVFLLPVLGIVDYGNLALSFVADQYLYLPSIGLLLPLVHFVDRLVAPGSFDGTSASAVGADRITTRRLATVAVSLVVVALTLRTLTYMPALRDGEAFWTKTLEGYPDCVAAHSGLGRVQESRGQWDLALAHYRRASELLPDAPQAQIDLSRALAHAGRYMEARQHLDRARKMGASREVSGTLIELARLARNERRIDDAVELYEEGLAVDPANAGAHIELGAVYLGLLQSDHAADQFRKAVDLQPANARAYLGLATSQRGQHRYAEAVATLRSGLRAAPGSLSLLNLLARLLATCPDDGVRDGAEAVRVAEQARASMAGHESEVMDTLAAAYAEAGRWSDAIDAARIAVEAAQRENSASSATILAHLGKYGRREPLREHPLEAVAERR